LSSAPWLGSEPSSSESNEYHRPSQGGHNGDKDPVMDANNEDEGDDFHDNESDNPKEDSFDPPDIKVRTIDQHEESVYSLAWSPADAWIYGSLSYDGR
jgi:hypothetical protein